MLDRSFTTVLDAGFDDVDQLCSTVRLWDLDFQPLQSGTAPGSVARVIQGGTRRFDCAYARILLNIDQRGAPPPGKITFTIPGRQLDAIWWQGQATTANDILVYFPGTEMKSLTGNDFEVHLISLTEDDILQLAERSGLTPPPLARLPIVFRAPAALIGEARHLLDRMRSDPLAIEECALDSLSEKLVRYWLGQAGIVARTPPTSQSNLVMDRILQAVSQRRLVDLKVSDYCVEAGLSRRALELAFRDRFGMGPAGFLKASRLAEARRLLVRAGDAGETVADVMTRCGFSHVGQFASDYRKMFAERPSETLRKSAAVS